MYKILVTGGCGFIGSNFIKKIVSTEDVRIRNLDCLTYAGNLDNLRDIDLCKYEWFQMDITNYHDVLVAVSNFAPDYIIHFAAESHVDRSTMGPLIFPQVNTLGTANMLEAARMNSSLKKFIHVSTDEVYGSIQEGFANEGYPLSTSSPYSASKAGADLLALSYYTTFGLPVVVTRCTNNYGPCQHVEKFIPRAITNALSGQNIKIYGTGENVRDWIWVEDHCAALWQLVQAGKDGRIYNIGYGDASLSNLTIAKKIVELADEIGHKIELEFVTDRPGHDWRYAVDIDKIRKEIKWWPQIKWELGLALTVEWYRQNEWWWKPQKEATEKFYQKLGR